MPLLYNGRIKINQGYHIFCKVDGTDKKRPYVLMINGGPGFGHSAIKDVGDSMKSLDSKQKLPQFNYIYFDALSCGVSDKAVDPENEFTMLNFAEIAAQVVEALQSALDIKEIDLRIIGVSFGGINSLAIPLVRPTWVTDNNSTIRLNQIISVVPLRNYEMTLRAMDHVREFFPDDPALEDKVAAVEKVVTGNIADMHEYQKIVWTIAGVYSQKAEEMQNSFIWKFIGKHLSSSIRILGMLSSISDACADSYDALAGCSLDVLTTFFKSRLNNFDATSEISNNMRLFSDINLTFIAGDKDHICNAAENAEVLQKLLPATSSIFVTNTRHSIRRDRPIEQTSLLHHLLHGTLPADWIENNSDAGTRFLTRTQLAQTISEQSARIQELDRSQSSDRNVVRRPTLFSRPLPPSTAQTHNLDAGIGLSNK